MVYDCYGLCFSFVPGKTDAILIVDADTVLPLAVPAEFSRRLLAGVRRSLAEAARFVFEGIVSVRSRLRLHAFSQRCSVTRFRLAAREVGVSTDRRGFLEGSVDRNEQLRLLSASPACRLGTLS
jgi:hypothetical protein